MNDYQIFISYRRDGGEFLAGRIADQFTSFGYKVFYDIESMRSGAFNTQILDAIDMCEDMILVLPQNGLDRCINEDDWVRQELAFALKHNKNIIPVMMQGFEFPQNLPDDIKDVRFMQGVSASSEFFDASMKRIRGLLKSIPQTGTGNNNVISVDLHNGLQNSSEGNLPGYSQSGISKGKSKSKFAIYIILALVTCAAVFGYFYFSDYLPIKGADSGNDYANVYISAGDDHTVGLRSDGTVIAAGDNNYGQCNVSHWRDIVSVAGGEDHTVGLTSEGTAIAVGRNNYGQCNVSNIDGITAISAGYDHTVLLMEDGTVIAVGNNSKGQCNVSNWSNIIDVCAGNYHTVGLKDDGTVVLAGNSYNVSSWNDIVAVAAGLDYTIGLKSDGTVVAKGNNDSGQCNVGDWSDIIEISAGEDHTVGLRSDGSVVAVGYNTYKQCNVSSWQNVLHITAGEDHTVAIMADGFVVSKGYNGFGQCDTSTWSSMKID